MIGGFLALRASVLYLVGVIALPNQVRSTTGGLEGFRYERQHCRKHKREKNDSRRRVLKEAVVGIEHFTRQQEEPLALDATVVEALLPQELYPQPERETQ